MRGGQGKRYRQEGAIKRTEAQLEIYEQKLVNNKDHKDLKKKIERSKTTIENTKQNMKQPKHSQVLGKGVQGQLKLRERRLGVTPPNRDFEVGMLCASCCGKTHRLER